MRATDEFPTLPSETVTVEVPAGDYAYQQLLSESVDVGEAPTRVLLLIRKVGAGVLRVDDVRLLSVANAAPFL